jgi:hypothetical protein
VTDAGLAHLRKLSRLRELSVVQTRVTQEGAATLTKAIPGLFVAR